MSRSEWALKSRSCRIYALFDLVVRLQTLYYLVLLWSCKLYLMAMVVLISTFEVRFECVVVDSITIIIIQSNCCIQGQMLEWSFM